jgi:hypothetical protein
MYLNAHHVTRCQRRVRLRGLYVDGRETILPLTSVLHVTDQPDISRGVYPADIWDLLAKLPSPSFLFSVVVLALTNRTLLLLLFRAPESGLHLAPFAKLSFTAVSSLHRFLVST